MTTTIKKLEQGRAEFAYSCVERAISDKEVNQNEYLSYSKKLPTMILTSGLGQTLAFVKAKAKNHKTYELLYTQMTEYLKGDTAARVKMPEERSDLGEWIVSCDSQHYRYATQELLAFLNWLKRFAEGRIER